MKMLNIAVLMGRSAGPTATQRVRLLRGKGEGADALLKQPAPDEKEGKHLC